MEGSIEITIKMSDRHVIISTLPEEVAAYRDKQKHNDPGSCLSCPLHTSVSPPAHTSNHTDGVCTVSMILWKTTELSRTLPADSPVLSKDESVDSY